MALIHQVYDTDAHFRIDPTTRVIKNSSTGKNVLIQYDHNSERFTFELPKLVDGHDMSKSTAVEIHYINIDSTDKTKSNSDIYPVDDLQISPENENVVICSWLISQNATQYAGSLNFLLKFKCVDDNGETVYRWHTAIFSGISVSSGMDNSEAVLEEYSDVLEQWKADITKDFLTVGTSYKVTGSGKISKWCRILNISRVINGTLHLNLFQGSPSYMAQNVSLDISGYVRWDGDTKTAKPVIVQNYNNIYGVDGVVDDPLKQARITKIRVAYPKRDADYGEDGNFPIPNEEGEYQSINNPVYCYVDALIEVDRNYNDGASSPYIYMNYTGNLTSKCVPITKLTVVDDSTVGTYGEQLDFFEFELNTDIDFYMPDRKIKAKEVYAENIANALVTTKSGTMIKLDDASPFPGEALLNMRTATILDTAEDAKAIVYGKNLVNYIDLAKDMPNCTWDKAAKYFRLRKTADGYATAFAPTYIPANTPFIMSCTFMTKPSTKPNMTLCVRYADGTTSSTTTYVMGTVLTHEKDIVAIRFGVNTALEDGSAFTVRFLQVEIGEQVTEYVDYVEPQEVTGVNQVSGVDYTAQFKQYPECGTTIFARGKTKECSVTYNRDIVKAFAELQNAIISLGGNV